MTVRELIKALQDLGEKHQDKIIVMFDGPSYYTPDRVELMNPEQWGGKFQDKVLID